MNDTWSQVPALVRHMPEPQALKTELKNRINNAYYELVKERGQVTVPQDTFDMQRKLGGERDRFAAYLDAFKSAVALLKQLQEEELTEAVGEQDGIPNQGLTIPDVEGDIRLSLDTPRVYDIDMDQVIGAYAADMVARADGTEEDHRHMSMMVLGVVEWLHSIGKFEPQVSKVRAFAATLAREGNDTGSAVVSGAITERTPYKGVKFERKRS